MHNYCTRYSVRSCFLPAVVVLVVIYLPSVLVWYGMVWYGMVDVCDGYLAAEVVVCVGVFSSLVGMVG